MVSQNEWTGYEVYAGNVRKRFAEASDALTTVLQINSIKYQQILQIAQLAISQQKLSFLRRYAPMFKRVSSNYLEMIEVYFKKEKMNRSHLIKGAG
jgi:hypothetical protein